MATHPKMTAQDRKWQAENDARTLSEADIIQGDTKRMKAAAKEAKNMAVEKAKEVTGLKNIARKKPRKA